MKPLVSAAIFFLFVLTLPAQAPPPGGGPPGPGVQGDGIWIRNAFYGEAQTFDSCLGHQPENGLYHHHAQPICLRAQLDDNLVVVRPARTGTVYRESSGPYHHSPILGWTFDGTPVYGPYGYFDPADPASEVRRIRSGFALRQITARTTLPDWAMPFHTDVQQQLSPNQYGPEINNFYPLGRYLEDFEYIAGSGDLDQYNGRFAVTPEYPNGVYAYYVTIDENGRPAFPYILGAQYRDTVVGGQVQQIPASAQPFVEGGVTTASSDDPRVNSWHNAGADHHARVKVGYAPDSEPEETWPNNLPSGLTANGGASTPVPADVQTVRRDGDTVYVASQGMASYEHHGPWFDPAFPGGIFGNYPSGVQLQIELRPQAGEAQEKTTHGLGPVGMWVNGVAIFNILDGASYSNAGGSDVGGGIVRPAAVHVSAASFEQGPLAPGSLVTAFSLFGAVLATSTETAPTPDWPTELGGATASVRDSLGTVHGVRISYASPNQVNYRLPESVSPGTATVTITAGGTEVTGNIFVVPAYPNLFRITDQGLAAANVVRVRDGQQTTENVFTLEDGAVQPATLQFNGDDLFLVLYGTGLGAGTPEVSVTVNGAQAELLYAGPQGTYDGLDQFNIHLSSSLQGNGKTAIVVTVDGRVSNAVYVWF